MAHTPVSQERLDESKKQGENGLGDARHYLPLMGFQITAEHYGDFADVHGKIDFEVICPDGLRSTLQAKARTEARVTLEYTATGGGKGWLYKAGLLGRRIKIGYAVVPMEALLRRYPEPKIVSLYEWPCFYPHLHGRWKFGKKDVLTDIREDELAEIAREVGWLYEDQPRLL